jgi:electron transfer flavoprotein alpha subunit
MKFSNKFSFKRSFSTLIVPQIANNKLHQSALNLVTAASHIDKDIHILLYGSENIPEYLIKQAKDLKHISKVITYTTDKVNLKDPSGEHLSSLVTSVNKIINYDSIITSSNSWGKNFLPRVGGILNIQPLTDVCKIESKSIFYRYFYAGNALSRVESSQKPNLLTIRLTNFDKSEESNTNKVDVQDLSSNKEIEGELTSTKSSTFVENLSAKTDKVELTQAKVVVSGGRALNSADNFKLVQNLADCFENSAIGASRAAVDAGYVPNELQIGQTGKLVAPDLYFAIGISGAIQHVAGIKDAKVIVAINKDPDSPIFGVSTYGLVGDLFQILPELTQKIKALKK